MLLSPSCRGHQWCGAAQTPAGAKLAQARQRGVLAAVPTGAATRREAPRTAACGGQSCQKGTGRAAATRSVKARSRCAARARRGTAGQHRLYPSSEALVAAVARPASRCRLSRCASAQPTLWHRGTRSHGPSADMAPQAPCTARCGLCIHPIPCERRCNRHESGCAADTPASQSGLHILAAGWERGRQWRTQNARGAVFLNCSDRSATSTSTRSCCLPSATGARPAAAEPGCEA